MLGLPGSEIGIDGLLLVPDTGRYAVFAARMRGRLRHADEK
jgi:hypothetical protein